LDADAGLLVAAEWLQVRVHVLARSESDVIIYDLQNHGLLVVALKRCGLVAAARLPLLWAVVFAVFVWQLLVEWVAAGHLGALLIEFDIGRVSWGHDVLVIKRLRGERGGGGLLIVIPASSEVLLRRYDNTYLESTSLDCSNSTFWGK
jgi:hypothetical protein